jgi:hypothetical protein
VHVRLAGSPGAVAAALSSCTWKGRVRSWPSFRLVRGQTEARLRSRPSSRVPALGALDQQRLSCEHRRALTVILLGFNNGRAGRMALFTHAGVATPAGAANCPGSAPRRPPPWAFALRRAAAAWCGGFPAGASRPPSAVAPTLPPSRVRGYAPPSARRAPRALETVMKVLTAPGRHPYLVPLDPCPRKGSSEARHPDGTRVLSRLMLYMGWRQGWP